MSSVGADADELGRADLDGVRVDEPRVVRHGDGEREGHLVVVFLQPRRGRLHPEPPGLLRREGDQHSRGGSNHRPCTTVSTASTASL